MTEALDPNKIPFRVLKPLHRAVQEVTITALQTIENPPQRLQMEVLGGALVSQRLKSPTRRTLLAHIAGWYELCEAVHNALPDGDTKDALHKFIASMAWVEQFIEDAKKAQTKA